MSESKKKRKRGRKKRPAQGEKSISAAWWGGERERAQLAKGAWSKLG